jgi:ketosteroid isomerase-like protein
MKRRSIVFLLSFVAIASTAPAEGQDDRAVLIQALNDYASAFHSFDEQRVLNSYHEPLILIAGPAVRVMATRADTEAWMKAFWARLKERGFARGSEFSPLHVKQVSPTVAVASAQFVRYKADGQELERNGVTYVLLKAGDEWKIVVVLGHAPGNILRLD